ncbi:alpha/beta hydrolase [Neiella sp. HB171785]|uniref:Alpha/beta hydrolase n=1 Tax=Neiella litorisoli TaxID=2771431 RepID=A0A8J6R407_9GAMM|nr:alpha/beta hydrolase [Neiella litorisoli]MBD1391015.1 alpha/beta hydrolase [Neiella litorisoli]
MNKCICVAALIGVLLSLNAPAFGYDGSLAGFKAHVAEFAPQTPIPEQLTTTELNGATIRYGIWRTTKARKGLVVFASGRTEFIEKNLPAYTELLAKGFDVYTFDWRGQGLSERQLRHSEPGHIEDFAIYLADLDAFIQQIVQPEQQTGMKLLMGHSMGGHIGLRYLQQHHNVFDRAQFSSPMMGIKANTWLTRQFVGFLHWAGWGQSCAPGSQPVWKSYLDQDACSAIKSGIVSLPEKPERALLYSNNLNHLAQASCWVEQSLAHNPKHHLGLGCPTIDWVKAAFRSIEDAKGHLDQIKIPVVIVGSADDKVVTFSAQQQACSSMGNCCLWQTTGREDKPAAHEILIEIDDYTNQYWTAFDALTHSSDAGCACAELRDRFSHLQCSKEDD